MERRTYIVTGGASGLGEETAKQLFLKGANVSILDRDPKRGQKIVAEWSTLKEGGVLFSQVDVTKEGR